MQQPPYNPYAAPAAGFEPPPQQPGGAPQGWEVGEVVSIGWEAVKRSPVELVGGFFVTYILNMVVGQVPTVMTLAGIQPHWATNVFFSVLSIATGCFFMVGQIRAALAAARGQRVDFGVFFSGADKFLVTLLAYLILGLGVALGMVLLIVPGIILALGWSLALFLVVDAGTRPVEALGESWRATQGEKVKILLLGLVYLGLSILGACACFVGMFVVLPIVTVAFATVYLRLLGR